MQITNENSRVPAGAGQRAGAQQQAQQPPLAPAPGLGGRPPI
eukprot:gene24787-10429_t